MWRMISRIKKEGNERKDKYIHAINEVIKYIIEVKQEYLVVGREIINFTRIHDSNKNRQIHRYEGR